MILSESFKKKVKVSCLVTSNPGLQNVLGFVFGFGGGFGWLVFGFVFLVVIGLL